MKKSLLFNLIIYLIVIGLYLYQPILGAIGQFALGIIQLILAIKITLEVHLISNKTKSLIKYYWLSIFIWTCLLVFLIITSQIEKFSKIILYVVPMTIGLYFLVVIYLIKKKQ